MLEQLHQIQELCLRHEQFDDAAVMGRLIELHQTNPASFWSELSSLNIWGGMGSLADQCLASSRTASEAERKRDQKLVWQALVDIADAMRNTGHPNEQADSWASVFRSWMKIGV